MILDYDLSLRLIIPLRHFNLKFNHFNALCPLIFNIKNISFLLFFYCFFIPYRDP